MIGALEGPAASMPRGSPHMLSGSQTLHSGSSPPSAARHSNRRILPWIVLRRRISSRGTPISVRRRADRAGLASLVGCSRSAWRAGAFVHRGDGAAGVPAALEHAVASRHHLARAARPPSGAGDGWRPCGSTRAFEPEQLGSISRDPLADDLGADLDHCGLTFVRCSPIKSSAEWEGAASEPCRVSNVR